MSRVIALDQLDRFIRELDAQRTLNGVFAALTREVQRMGFQFYAYDLAWPPANDGTTFYFTTYPREWIAHYVEQRYVSDDVICQHMATRVSAFLWPEATRRPLTRRQKMVLGEAHHADVRTGALVPIHGPGPVRAYLAVASRETDDAFARLFSDRRHELHLIATYAHEKVVQIGVPNRDVSVPRLTPREIEVLTLAARGKTAAATADALDISEQTVKDHIKAVCRKLGVTNKTHAVSVALQRGMISL